MPLVATDAVVLHAFDYLETSRIYRLLTRDAGLQSVLARGARRSRTRYGTAVDLFAEGEAQMAIRPQRELQTLTAFDVTRARPTLGESLPRFTAAAAIAELALRFAQDDAHPTLFEAVCGAFDAIAAHADDAPADDAARARDAGLAGAWHVVAELGFTPTIDQCSACHADVPASEHVSFSHPLGGIVCARCSGTQRGTRVLPPDARDALRAWTRGRPWSLPTDGDGRAHQRLLREFLVEHLAADRPLRAFAVWEGGTWMSTAAAEHLPPVAERV